MKTGLRRSGKLAGGFSLLLALALVVALGGATLAGPPPPPPLPHDHQFWGSVTVCGEQAEAGTVVTATIDGVTGEWTSVVNASGYYGLGAGNLLLVPADNPNTPEKDGGVVDDTVRLSVLGIEAGWASFVPDGTTKLDLEVCAEYVELTVVASPVEGGTVTGSDTYAYGADAPITATENTGWDFVSWSTTDITEIDNPSAPSTTVYMDKSKTVTANFVEEGVTYYNLTMAKVGQGTVAPGSGSYPEGPMTITATPTSGWRFAGWSTTDMAEIANPSSASTTLTLDGDKTVTATFTERVGFYATLGSGWNLLSTPVLLDADSDSLGQIFDAESQGNMAAWLSWDAVNKRWVQIFADYELKPLYAIYAYVNPGALATAEFTPSEVLSGLPTRDLVRGVSLIGPAPALEAGDFPAMPLDQALISIKEAPGGLTGYTIVVSPAHNQPGWAYALGMPIKDLLPYKGYWVVMENADTLYGFSTTPLP